MKNTERTTYLVSKELEDAVAEYTVAKIAHDKAVEIGEITADEIKALGNINNKCEELAKEYATLAKQEFYESCEKEENPVKAFLTKYTYETKGFVDETVSKNDLSFAKRSMISKTAVGKLWEFEKAIGIQKEVISKQKDLVNKLTSEMTTEVAKKLKANITDLADMRKGAENISSPKKAIDKLQAVVDSILSEIECDSTDVAYLNYCFTRKGKDALSVKVLKDGGLVYVITDMIHKALTGDSYSVTGYKVKK